jgi:hypothetical protein
MTDGIGLKTALRVEGGPNLRIVGEYRGRSPARAVICALASESSASIATKPGLPSSVFSIATSTGVRPPPRPAFPVFLAPM